LRSFSFFLVNFGSGDRLALQNLQIPVGNLPTEPSQNGSSLAGSLPSKDLLLADQMLY